MVVVLGAVAPAVQAQTQYIGYVYPAGGQRGTTFPIRLGGQALRDVSGLVVSGEGVKVRLIDDCWTMTNEQLNLLREQMAELKKPETVLDEALVARMSYYEFPGTIGPVPPVDPAKAGSPKSEAELARQNLIARIEKWFEDDQRDPAVRSQTELVFAEVTVAPDARPGRREIRLITKRGISNALPFMIGQVAEVARKPMRTAQLPVLGKESLAQRKRPPEEVEMRVSLPCTMNGQVAAGEINRYRFQATKGQHLVISAQARDLVPYVADGVPGWFQAVLVLQDSNGREVAYNDDFQLRPDPLIRYDVPEDGEYVLSIHEALFRGRESFVYRITVSELPYLTSIFPLGGRVGEPVAMAMEGWNLDKVALPPVPADAKPGMQAVVATDGTVFSNEVPFVLDTLPECLETETPDSASAAASATQKVALPVIVNGRMDRPGDWDLFEIEGKAGETIVAEVMARRLGSPMDSFVEVTTPDGQVIALNDDHFDAGSGTNTHHADSYLMVKLPADGKYVVRLGETSQQGGPGYAYRLRLSPPRPDFELRAVPSRLVMPSKGAVAATVYAIRKDGFNGPIKLSFTNLPAGLESAGATIGPNQEVVKLGLKTTLAEMDQPVSLTIEGQATVGDQTIVHPAVPTEDRMQAFLWRHLLPAGDLPALVFNPGYQPPADRIRPPIRDEDRPRDVTPSLTRASVDSYMKQIETLYQKWFLTDEFTNRKIREIEARLIR
jgi:hypothetical protein